MKKILETLTILFLLSSCIGPLKELDRQIEDVYLASPLDSVPEPIPDNFVNKINIKKLWSFDLPELSYGSEPIFNENQIFLITQNGKFLKINQQSGLVEFDKQLEVKVSIGLFKSSDESIFFIDSNNYLTKIDHHAEVHWKIRLPKRVELLPIVIGNQIIIKYKNSDIEAFDSISSLSLWSYQKQNPPLSINLQSPIAFKNNIMYTGYPGGKIIAIDTDSGIFLAELTVSRASGVTDIDKANDISGDIAVTDSLIFAVSFNGELTAFDMSSGKKVWGRKVSSYSGVKTDNVNLILAHENDSIYNFDRDSGKTLWKADYMKYRKSSKPIIFNDFVLTTDYLGILHVISLDEGELQGLYNFDVETVINGVNPTKLFNNDNSFFVLINNNSLQKLSITND